jgi:hypothetical protein
LTMACGVLARGNSFAVALVIFSAGRQVYDMAPPTIRTWQLALPRYS